MADVNQNLHRRIERLKIQNHKLDSENHVLKVEVKRFESEGADNYEDIVLDRDLEIDEAYKEINSLKFLLKVFIFLK